MKKKLAQPVDAANRRKIRLWLILSLAPDYRFCSNVHKTLTAPYEIC